MSYDAVDFSQSRIKTSLIFYKLSVIWSLIKEKIRKISEMNYGRSLNPNGSENESEFKSENGSNLSSGFFLRIGKSSSSESLA